MRATSRSDADAGPLPSPSSASPRPASRVSRIASRPASRFSTQLGVSQRNAHGRQAKRSDSDLPTEVTEGSPRHRVEREKGGGRNSDIRRERETDFSRWGAGALGENRGPNTRPDGHRASPYSDPLPGDPDSRSASRRRQAEYGEPRLWSGRVFGPGSPFAIFATFAREFRSSSAPLRLCGKNPLPASSPLNLPSEPLNREPLNLPQNLFSP